MTATRQDSMALVDDNLDCQFRGCCEPCDKCYQDRCPACVPTLTAYPVSVEESGSQFVPSAPWPWIRGVFAILSVIFLIWDISRWVRKGWGPFWPMLLTHWVFALSVIYLCLKFSETVILYRAYQENDRVVTMKELGLSNLARATRIFLNLTLGSNLLVIVLFWGALFKWSAYKNDMEAFVLTLYKHGISGVLVITDVFIGASWVRHKDAVWVVAMAIFWLVWTLIHWQLGLKNQDGCNCIYGILNWNKPASAVALTIGAQLIFPVFHWGLVFAVNYTRNKCGTDLVWDNLPVEIQQMGTGTTAATSGGQVFRVV